MKPIKYLLASVAIVAAAPAALAQSETDSVDLSVPTQLPRTAIPHHYAIRVTPHAERLAFDATVAIDLEIVQPTSTLTLNAADLKITSATLKPAKGGAALKARVSTDADAQTATFTLPRQVGTGSYRLEIAYSGQINTQANGLFALDYTDIDGKPARALFTQFEAADARRFVPSWDEPDYKATFDLTARVPAREMAVSNMPATATRKLPGGLKEVRFQRTPVMSSYLLFFSSGDFDRITKPAAGAEMGIVVSRGSASKAQLALDAEAQILPYYNEYFGRPYPLPKLDNVAGPGQSQFFSAMENWGAIFTFERTLLFDPAISTEADRQRIFSVEAHEMAHQWFGDLVTMAWWDDLWLNESFASWMASKTTEHFHPDWGADIDRIGSREEAMGLDSFEATHPILQTIRTVEQANQAFDNITYEKGQSVITMLEAFAGSDVWRRGIQSYISKHAYQNSRTRDLWNAIEGAGATGLNAIANDFTSQPGVPLIVVGPAQCAGGQTVTQLTQSQYSADQREKVVASPLSWHVPVRATAGAAPAQIITNGRTTSLAVPGCGPLLVNAGQTGYYRTLYQPAQAAALTESFTSLAPVDQYGLLTDQVALSGAAYQPLAIALNMLDRVPTSGNAKVVQVAAGSWSGFYDEMEAQPELRAAIAKRVIGRFGPRLQQLGFVPKAGEPALDAILRPTLILTLGKMKDPAVVAEANRLFAAWQADPNAIPGSVKEAWLAVIAANADEATWNALHARAKATTGIVERTALYALLGGARDEALARRALKLALTDEPGKTISAGIITSVAGVHPRLAVDFVLAHLAQVNQLVDISGRSRFMQRLAGGSSDETLVAVLENYAQANLAETDRKPIEQSVQGIRYRSAKLPRERQELAAWLRANPA